ncbi:uncharacterized protein LOC110828535 [Zootermopsis nevadensis]|uniref:Fibronectin type III domain-containing protein n=1 Tax=Zootermopsis nevadensis TaxID=136037 RepID=A0A067RD60_ZOONE|nr:uncharacterized protein LOC110828535 [Zootermopsis nevadensis]KDR20979.1 hypothetical protein L798_04491 [Zootermopsis nevadensis]
MRNFSSTEFPEPVERGNRPRPPALAPTLPTSPSVSPPPLGAGGTSPIVVRAEEALIVLLVLVLWIAAIALFFNRWGKIRMLEPYQPKFQQQHRSSCPMVDINGPIGLQHRTFSKFNVNCIGEPIHTLHRPRQNSVFVGSSATMVTLPMNPPRKTKSAMDIQTLVLAECEPGHSGTILPMTTVSPAGSRRPSCTRLDSIHITNV